MRFWTFTDAFGSFRRFRRVVTCYNWASSDGVRLHPVCRYVLTIISVRISHECDETSLTVTRIAHALSEQWPLDVVRKSGNQKELIWINTNMEKKVDKVFLVKFLS